MGGSVKQGQPGHSYRHWEGKPTGLPGKMSLVWLPLLSCSTHTGTEGAGFASQPDLPHSGVSPEHSSGAGIRLSTGSQSGWCHPALYSHSQATALPHGHSPSPPPPRRLQPPQQQRMVFDLATWLSKQQGGSKTKLPVVLLTWSPREDLFGEKYQINSSWVGSRAQQNPRGVPPTCLSPKPTCG